ncbi:MAG: hypothetical protein ABIY71_12725 [Flavobacteriales bacterium]
MNTTSFTKALVDTLPEAVKRTMAGEYEQLISANQAATSHDCFLVGKQCYFSGQRVYPMAQIRGVPPALPTAFMPAFQSWKAPFKRLNQDLARITQSIASIVLRAKTPQDIRDMFPEHFLRPLLGGWETGMDLQRTRLDLYADNPDGRQEREQIWEPKLLDMYERIAPTIDLYLGYKLL